MLTDDCRAVLDLEARSWVFAGEKETTIRSKLGLTPGRYYQRLNALLDDPGALEYAPVTVNRLRRIRESRRGAR